MISIENIIYLAIFLINTYIIIYDIKYKKIKNIHLLILILLFIFYFIYMSFSINTMDILMFFPYLFSTFIFSFILYYFNIWAAGDTKYFFILTLFLYFFSGFFDFLINFSILVLFYIFFTVFFHYLLTFFSLRKIKHFFWINYELFKEKYLFIFFDKWNEETTKELSKKKVFIVNFINYLTLVIFLFILIRLFRIFIIEYIDFSNYKENIFELMKEYWVYILLLLIGILFWIRRVIMFVIDFFKSKIVIKSKLSKENYFVKKIIKSFIFLFLNISIVFIFYLLNWNEVFGSLYIFFIRFITFTIFIKLIFHLFKIYFKTYEETDINITNLKSWDYINYDFLDKKIWNIYDYVNEKDISKIHNPIQLWVNPINKTIILELKDIINKYNNHHTSKNTINFEKLENIKIINTFAFSPFLFLWFLITIISATNFIKILLLFIQNNYN